MSDDYIPSMDITNNIVVEVGLVDASGQTECVTAQELYDHLSLNCGLSVIEAQLESFITSARQQFEHSTDGRVVLPTVFYQHLTEWPKHIRLQRGPVLDVESVIYYDEDDDEQELEAVADISSVPALVYKDDFDYPALSTTRVRPITVEFTAGWADVDAVPKDVKLAILLLAGHYYAQREEFSEISLNQVPMGFQRVCDKYRTGLSGW